MITSFSTGGLLGGQDFKNDEVLLVFFILFLWGVVLSIFFQRWGKNCWWNISIKDLYYSGKIRSLLPYQPVYSKEMAVKIEQIETEKKIRSNRTSFSFYPVDCDCSVKVGNLFILYFTWMWKTFQHEMNSLGKTSSTLLLKQPNSLDVDGDQLRKTKSAENICCPQIIIDQVSFIHLALVFSSILLRPFLTPQLGYLSHHHPIISTSLLPGQHHSNIIEVVYTFHFMENWTDYLYI